MKLLPLLIVILSFAFALAQPIHLQLFGNRSIAFYYANLYVGVSPSLEQKFLVDTGSSLTSLYCRPGCVDCETKRKTIAYNPNHSLRGHLLSCDSGEFICKRVCKPGDKECMSIIVYVDGTEYLGNLVADVFKLDLESKVQLDTYFQCSQYQATRWKQLHDGLLGMGPVPSQTVLYSWLPQMQKDLVFSLCLATNGGYMELGAPDDDWLTSEEAVEFNYWEKSQSFRVNKLNELKLGKVSISKPPPILFDSGTTATDFPPWLINRFVAEFRTSCKAHSGCKQVYQPNCFQIYADPDQVLPLLSIRQGQSFYQWHPSQYLTIMSEDGTLYCFEYNTNENNQLTFGANIMKNRKIIHDLDRHKIIIGPPQDCTYRPRVAPSGFNLSQYLQNTPVHYLILAVIACLCVFYLLGRAGKWAWSWHQARRRRSRLNQNSMELSAHSNIANSSTAFPSVSNKKKQSGNSGEKKSSSPKKRG